MHMIADMLMHSLGGRENQATETVWSRDLIKRDSNWGDTHGGTLVCSVTYRDKYVAATI